VKRTALAFLALAGLTAPGRAAEWEPEGVHIGIGHSYSSASALAQPATLVLVAEEDAPLLARLDAGILARGPLGRLAAWETGIRAATGSARPASRRVYGAVARGWRVADPLIVAFGGEYEADGDFEVEKGVINLETSPLGGAPGLGRWVRPGLRLRWRPWLGLGYGNVFDPGVARSDIESKNFWRAYARVEVSYQPVGRARCDLEATSWLVDGDIRGTNYLKAALAVPITGGLSLSADLAAGRQPPRFERERRVGLGIGFYRALRSD
jgi:hypothetical protein